MKHIIICFIKIYQLISKLFLPRACRFYPTCSEYALQALQRYGCIQGLWLSIKRILKCHPFHPGGYDPVR